MTPSRTGSVSLTDRDRTFLHEYVQFGHLHHVVVAEALRSAYERADVTATAMREQVERTDRATAEAGARRLNDGARVQTVVVARLLSEYAAAIEDLGALIHAIRQRARRGVMVEYLETQVQGAADTLDLLIARRGEGLAPLLTLPRLDTFADRVDPVALEGLRHDYEFLAAHFAQIAGQYRDPGPQGVATDVVGVPEDHAAIVLGLVDQGEDTPDRRGGLLAQAHNKIKHRFMVIEDIAALGVVAGGNVLYTHYPRDPRAVRGLVHNITQVALAGAELAALMLALDGAVAPKQELPASSLDRALGIATEERLDDPLV